MFLLQRDFPLHWTVPYQPAIQKSILASQWMAIYCHETFPHSCYDTVQYDHSVTPFHFSALMDTGADGNITDLNTVHHKQYLKVREVIHVQAIDGKPVSNGNIMHPTIPICFDTSDIHSEVT